MWGRRAALCARVLVVLLLLALVYRLSLQSVSMEKSPELVYILIWTLKYTEPLSQIGKGSQNFVERSCPVKKCYTTANRGLLSDITEFDAVLFHGKEVIGERAAVALPPAGQRALRQQYVFASMESAGYYPVRGGQLDRYFNVTWTYKTDSDIYFGYIVIREHGKVIGPRRGISWLKHGQMLPTSNFIKNKLANKSCAAALFVSNCRTPSKRQEVVEEIKSEMKEYGMSLDVFGACGTKSCPRDRRDCFNLIQNNYYFYFAFENSFAEDYVTEKLMIALKHYAVPVVFGGADYTRFMPDGAYLDARALGTPELVRQMFEIMSDPDRYSGYFRWHNHYSYHHPEESPDTDPLCALCEYLHRHQSENRTTILGDFEHWWNPE